MDPHPYRRAEAKPAGSKAGAGAPAPEVSVVVGVRNGAAHLRASLTSVLEQDGVDLELIVVDDGSEDQTPDVLQAIARADGRVCALHQEGAGLTRALIRGCAAARGEYIARHDADDISSPNRLARQADVLRKQPDVALVSCWVRAVGPEGETLQEHERVADSEQATLELRRLGTGPAHGSVMFRRHWYESVGGYHPEFRYAQDWDLWLRLTERGRIAYVAEWLYVSTFSTGSISACRRRQQGRLARIVESCRDARAEGRSETPVLLQAKKVSAEPPETLRAWEPGPSYFIGKCLLDRRDPGAVKYLKRATREQPWSVRPWLALAVASWQSAFLTVKCP